MLLKIVSDGTPLGTALVDAETGARVQGVQKIIWEIDTENLSRAIVHLVKVPMEAAPGTISLREVEIDPVVHSTDPNGL